MLRDHPGIYVPQVLATTGNGTPFITACEAQMSSASELRRQTTPGSGRCPRRRSRDRLAILAWIEGAVVDAGGVVGERADRLQRVPELSEPGEYRMNIQAAMEVP
jgi:hypothetical protein